ncbi:ribonuclease Z [bacterium A37T11]|nr:ribonuclease Z [bacterium A37T11]
MTFEVTILGSSSATPIYGRHPSSQIINHHDHIHMIDCGEGTQQQLQRFGIRANKIRHIFISHLHGDHFFGLIGLLSSMHLVGRKEELHLYGPAPLKEILDLQLYHSQTTLRYDLFFHPTQHESPAVIFEDQLLRVSTFPLSHRIPCTGFRFDEKPRQPKVDMEKVKALEIPPVYYPLIKQGKGYRTADGDFYPSAELTIPSPAPRSYAYCSDTIYTPAYVTAIWNVNLLYHEATFLDEMRDRAEETYHTTALQAGLMAFETQAKELLIGHFSARYKQLEPLLEEASSVFEATQLAKEGATFKVKYAV